MSSAAHHRSLRCENARYKPELLQHLDAQLRQNAAELDDVLAIARRNLSIAILGGSISAGSGVGIHGTYGYLLQAHSQRLRVLNRAVRATSSALPSFCLDQLVSERIDAVLIEYAVNDGGFLDANLAGSVLSESSPATAAGHAPTEDTSIAGAILGAVSASRAGASRLSPLASIGGQRLDPMVSMERLLRRIRLSWPHAIPLLLYMCPRVKQDARQGGAVHNGGDRTKRCEGLYSDLARLYNVTELSMRQTLGDTNESMITYAQRIHPDCAGHTAMASAVIRELTASVRALVKPRSAHRLVRLALGAGSAGAAGAEAARGGDADFAVATQSPLPPPRHMDAAWERVDTVWGCRTCDWAGCASLQPKQYSSGFERRGFAGVFVPRTIYNATTGEWRGNYAAHPFDVHKYGWSAHAVNETISFAVRRGAHVQVAFLCSYQSVGVAAVTAGRGSRERLLELQWSDMSSQQCVLDLGTVTNTLHSSTRRPPHAFVHRRSSPPTTLSEGSIEQGGREEEMVTVRVASARDDGNQVKIYGVYEQAPVAPPTQR